MYYFDSNIPLCLGVGFEAQGYQASYSFIEKSLEPLKPKNEELQKVANFYSITKAKIGKKWIYKVLAREQDERKTWGASNHVNMKNTPIVKGDYIKALRKKP